MVRSSVVGLIFAGFLATGCTPSCERTCRKLLDCGSLESDRVSQVECEASCDSQNRLYESWDDEKELDKAFDQHRRCLVQNSCGAIADGACFDDRLFPVGIPVTELDTGL